MKTTVGSAKERGRASVQPLQQSGEIMLIVTNTMCVISAAALDASAAHVLGHALIRLAEQTEADQAERAAGYVAKYEAKNEKPISEARRQLNAYWAEQAKKEQGARCHGDQCAAGQIACPSPKDCGVAA